jgi:hypothetical protein
LVRMNSNVPFDVGLALTIDLSFKVWN